jgi:hypothetical protein
MTNYLRVAGWTLLAVTIIHGYASGPWRGLHALGVMLATRSIAGAQAH